MPYVNKKLLTVYIFEVVVNAYRNVNIWQGRIEFFNGGTKLVIKEQRWLRQGFNRLVPDTCGTKWYFLRFVKDNHPSTTKYTWVPSGSYDCH